MPVATGSKADRLPIKFNQDTLADADKVDVTYVSSTEQAPLAPPQSAAGQAAAAPLPEITPRHWHDPRDVKAKAAKPKANRTKQSKEHSTHKPADQIGGVKECRSDALDLLLRKLNLSPPCDS
jgi:hypothetical protein